MRVLSRLLVWCLSACLTVPLMIFAAGVAVVLLSLPGGDRTSAIPGLSAPASIALDADGVAHVRAATARDGAAALGYAHARERMFQMELMRRAASGTLSAIAGPATLPLDRMMRTLGLRRAAERDLPGLDADTRAMLDAYATGVNAWIAQRGRRSGLEFLLLGPPAPWTPVDTLLWGKTMQLYLSGNWRTELARLALLPTLGAARTLSLWPESPAEGHPEASLDTAAPSPASVARVAARLAAVIPRFPAPFTLPDEASNEWAVDGHHTASGAPLLAGDPHLAFGLPGIWYLARVDTPGATLAGATAPGGPILVLGHNGHIAWSFTTTGADTQDLFIETPAGAGLYQTPDGPRPIVTRTERIAVLGHPDELLQVRETRHGPLISDLVDPTGPMLALSASFLMPGDTAASGLLALNRATDVDQAGEAAARITAPVQNLMVADRQRIALFVTGRVPVRRAGDGALPQAGADGQHDWLGFASGSVLPRIVAPSSGRLVNANERVAPPDYGVFLGRDWFDDFRARRIREMLAATDAHTPADFAAMQADAHDRFALDILPRLVRLAPSDPASRTALDLLRGWDGNMGIGAPQPLIFVAWMRRFGAGLLARSGITPEHAGAAAEWPDLVSHALAHDDCAGPCDTALLADLQATMAELVREHGADQAAWRWGDIHQAVFAHPLLRAIPFLGRAVEARIASPGGDTTVDRGGMRAPSYDSVHGASYRGVYDLSDLDHSLFMVAPGQSGNPASPLSRNFVRRWRDGATTMLGPYPAVSVRITLLPGARP